MSCVLLAALLAAFPASAAQRTFVSGAGSDVNTASGCSLSSPCRSFGAAIGQTIAGGEVVVLDSAGYGVVTISSVTENLAGGIVASGGAVVVVADTRVAKTPDPIAYGGIWSSGAGSSLQATRCEVSGYGIAYYADAGGQMQIIDSVATGYPNGAGVEVVGAGSTIDVERSSMNHFVIGFYSHGNATLRISASTATAVNTSMLAELGGSIYSRQNNMSGSGTSGTITPLSPI